MCLSGADLVVLQTGDEDLGEEDHAGAADSSAAVDQHRQVGVLGVADAVGVSPHRLDLLQVGCETEGRSSVAQKRQGQQLVIAQQWIDTSAMHAGNSAGGRGTCKCSWQSGKTRQSRLCSLK